MELLEYYQDMKHWWGLSYGDERNGEVGCKTFEDVVRNLPAEREARGKRAWKKGVFRFGHSETNVFLVTLLGLYKDPLPLSTNHTAHNLQNRTFRTSNISPFASNIVFEVARCQPPSLFSPSSSSSSNDLIRIIVNEQDAPRMKGCPEDSEWCPVGVFLEGVKGKVGCDWEEVCGVEGKDEDMDEDEDGEVDEWDEEDEDDDGPLVLQV
ncbi:PHOsphatase [Rhizophlyctis rosea]|uniref:Multiple inositol polyphosphate phosphatase 1 n=1 Tax=Rhizophlyctis rosea TaxID=64517 RepID=A0AAD5S7C6_9FUNG|nr:PHOsphatase [Rhizophlyctis rosea]